MRELARDGRRRFHHRIIVTPNGIIFDDGERRVEICWDEVTDYFVAQFGRLVKLPAHYVVVTGKGSFDFTTMLKDYKVLKRLIEQNARNASVKGWRLEGERLGKPMQQHGAMVFHYRTRSIRTLLLVGTGLAIFCDRVDAKGCDRICLHCFLCWTEDLVFVSLLCISHHTWRTRYHSTPSVWQSLHFCETKCSVGFQPTQKLHFAAASAFSRR